MYGDQYREFFIWILGLKGLISVLMVTLSGFSCGERTFGNYLIENIACKINPNHKV